MKPCKQAEINFYQSVESHPELKYYMPLYMGFLQLNQEATDAAAADLSASVPPPTGILEQRPNSAGAIPVTETWEPSNGAAIAADSGIVLENVAHGFKKPNILDVKLGARLWADDSPAAKRDKLDKVSGETTSKPLGFRIAGMKTYVGQIAEPIHHDINGYRKYDKYFGRSLKVDNVHTGFKDFFFVEGAEVPAKFARRVVKRFLEDLQGLQEVLENEETRMYSASLLFVYEGDGEQLAKNFVVEAEMLDARAKSGDRPESAESVEADNDTALDVEDEEEDEADLASSLPKIQALKMIDFAHAQFTKGQGPDENVLHGIRSITAILERIIR